MVKKVDSWVNGNVLDIQKSLATTGFYYTLENLDFWRNPQTFFENIYKPETKLDGFLEFLNDFT